MENIVIIGSRDFRDLDLVREYIDGFIEKKCVISGGARGVDQAAADHAVVCGHKTWIFPADWKRFGRKAGIIRNREMVTTGDRVVAFWDGKSRGTQYTIEYDKLNYKSVEIIRERERIAVLQ